MSLHEGKENLFLAKEKQNKRPQAVFRVDLLTHLSFMKNYFYIHTVESAFLLCKLEAFGWTSTSANTHAFETDISNVASSLSEGM